MGLHKKDNTNEEESLTAWLKKLRDVVEENLLFRRIRIGVGDMPEIHKEKTFQKTLNKIFMNLKKDKKARNSFRKAVEIALHHANKDIVQNILEIINTGIEDDAKSTPNEEGYGGHNDPWHFILALKEAVQKEIKKEIKSAIPSGISKEDYEKLLQTKEGPIKALTERLDKIEKEKDTKIALLEQDNKLLKERLKKVENVIRLLIQAIRIIKN